MTTLEKLLVQIFERKNWIIEEVQRQVDAYTEQLASRLLIDGITPPPSLLTQRFNPRSSDSRELKKEEIISKLLLPHPRESVHYSTGGHSLHDKPVVDRGNVHISNEMSMETHNAPNKLPNITNEPSNTLACPPNNDTGCRLDRVVEQDNSVDSPQNETDARISSIYAAPDSSLARIQRSKSRQKALELRNSGRTAAKSCLSKEDRTRISFSEDTTTSQNDFHQVIQDKFPSETDKSNHHSKTNDKEVLYADGVMEGVISLGSYGAEKSVTVKTHDTQRQSKQYSGRITRSRGSSQQTSGINKSLDFGTSAKEGSGAVCYSIGDLKLGSNKLLDAVETCQSNSDRIGETEAICNSKEVVISSNISASRVTRSKSGSMKECHQENAEIVIDDVPVAVKLDAVTESDGVALEQSTECCMLVKPKQLNFDETDGCDSDKISRKRKLDGLLCDPLTFEKDLEMENQVSSQLKSARTHSDVERMDIGLEMNGLVSEKRKPDPSSITYSHEEFDDKSSEQQSPMEYVPVSSKAATTHSHEEIDEMMNMNENPLVDDGAAILCEVDESGFINPSFTSCETKQGETDGKKELEDSNLSKLKMNTWPRDPQRNIEDQTNHRFSYSHIQRDAAIHCDLFDDDLYLSKSDDIQKATVAEVDDATFDQTGPNISNMNESEAEYEDVDVAITDEMMPVYEGFTIHEQVGNAINFDTLASSTIERASIIEQICKSANTHTPFSQFSSTFKQHQVQDLYKLMPDGVVEDFSKHMSESDYTFSKQQTSDSVQFSGTPYNWQSKSYYTSPVGKLWDRSASSSGSRLSSNPELTCFPIEEDPDPDSNEDCENEENITMKTAASNEEKIIEIVTTENNDDDEVAVGIVPKREAPPSGPMKYRERCSSNSVNVQVNVPRTHDKVKYKSKFHPGYGTPSFSIRRNASLQTQNSKIIMTSGLKKRATPKEVKSNNIVSNVTSFVSIVQQKQAAAVAPVKRDIKVKALEAAEAAKRREQEKENERKMKKEALKIERARVEKQNARENEINKKKKQEEMKRKEADVAARRKQREEDERKQVAKKRKIAEARKEQKLQQRFVKNGGSKKGSENVSQNKKSLIQQATSVAEKERNIDEKSPGLMGLTSQEKSYDISPYQCSDDEDDNEDDELPTNKFVPSWASKKAVAMVLPLQQELDPETIFPVGSFCRMDQVLLPRRLQTQ